MPVNTQNDLDLLEPEQRAARLREQLPRRKLGSGLLSLLWLLRVYVLIAVPLVIYAFVEALIRRP